MSSLPQKQRTTICLLLDLRTEAVPQQWLQAEVLWGWRHRDCYMGEWMRKANVIMGIEPLWGKRLSSLLPNLLADLLKSICIRTLEIFICAQMTMSFSLQKAFGNLNFSFTINWRLGGESRGHGLDVNSHPYTLDLYLMALFGRIGGI